MVYWRIVRSSYRRNLQYRLSHLVNNLASAIFGLVYIAIWAGVLGEIAPYLPFAGVFYQPVGTYLEMAPPTGIAVQAAWALALTLLALRVTKQARRKIEIQGG
jgi:ABC-2 type transport system permease protein